MTYSKFICAVACVLGLGFIPKSIQPDPAIKIERQGFHNLYKVSNELYRSEQPDRSGMQELEKLGVASVLNLRNRVDDHKRARNTSLVLMRVRINAWTMYYEDVLQSLKLFQSAKKPVLVHCLHGSDRTGVVIAAYRMVYQDWSREDAIKEFTEKQFGYHKDWFPRLLDLLENLDVARLKQDLKK
ncbi:MAG: protein tyrosine phosphatase [Bacteroidetes bacterium]|nr:protein tyrosine phosphatase [Bacteroidota bacterium]